ncbi:MAG: hypothetical protein ACWA5W_06095 [Phycisphaerales bacterium]
MRNHKSKETRRHPLRWVSISASACALWCSLCGCASTQSQPSASAQAEPIEAQSASRGEFAPDQYEIIFRAAREVLSEYRFGINRVDLSRGILTTHPKRTSGLATLWDREQSSLDQELEDFANQHEREVRITFTVPEEHTQAPATMRVEVMVYRIHRPNWRLEPESIRLSTHAQSRNTAGQLEKTSFREALTKDNQLADRIAQAIQDRIH